MNDTNAASLGWIIKVAGTGREYRFRAGDSVIIGRTPLRPSVNDADRRLDIDDSGKSMSKKHARFEVRSDGTAVLRDLHSTNGTYIVRADGDLMRLPLDQDYSISRTPLKLQFGDVRIELHREVRPAGGLPDRAETPLHKSDLFAHASQVTPEGVESPSLSVDDILDVRAGEPTEMFNAHQVRKQVLGSRAASQSAQSQTAQTDWPQTGDANPVTDAETSQTGNSAQQGNSAGSDFARMKQDLEEQNRMQREFLEKSAQEQPEQSAQSAQSRQPAQVQPYQSQPDESQASSVEPPVNDTPDFEDSYSAHMGAAAHQVTTPRSSDFVQQQATPQSAVSSGSNSGAVFEPGSVFDRLTRGELGSHIPAVEIGELNSDDAQRTSDQTAQFEMAKHRELLPFLAMNPYLYDDLYAWLEAIGDPDITSALAVNSGYATYREGRK